jgi:hypothetical protein
MNKILLLVAFFFLSYFSWGQIYQHDFGTTAISAYPYNVAPTIFNANLNTSSWSNSTGSWTSFAGSTGQAISLNDSSGTPTITLTFNVATGYQMSVSSFNFWRRRSASGSQNWSMTINGIDVGSGTVPTTGAAIGTTVVASPVSNLTGVITVVLSLSGASGTGTFRLDDFTLNGTVTTTAPSPEINLQGLGISIFDGDTTPITTDDTAYGSVLTSTNTTHTFTIQNTGTDNLILTGTNPVTLSNTTNGFSVTQPGLLTIPAGSSTTFTVTFNSATAGTFPNTINIANNDSDENPYDFSITATAVVPAPEINIAKDISSSDIPTGSTANTGFNTVFAALNIGNNATKTYYIENEGTANLAIGTVTITGLNPGDFSISAIPSTINVGSTLASSIPFTITFTPLASGIRSATISIINNDSNENPYTFDVQGTGTCPTYTTSASPTSGPIGSTVTITSTLNLSGSNTATLNGTPLTVTAISATQISVVIPSGATTGIISITNFQGCTVTTLFNVITNVISGCEGGSASTPTELFISQVTDASSGGLSYIELYNGTGTTKNLGTYSLNFYNNGNAAASGGIVLLPTFNLSNGAVYVVAVGGTTSPCSGISGSDGSLANFSSITGGVNFNVNGSDHIKLFNGATEVDQWGVYNSNNWADALGLGTAGANFSRLNTATVPSTTYNNADWNIVNWVDCSNNDYSDVGLYDFSVGVPPSVSAQPVTSINCSGLSITTSGAEGFPGGLGLAYQWFVSTPGSGLWTAVNNGGVYSGATAATLTISSTFGLNDYQYYCQIRENTVTCFTATNSVKITDNVSVWNGTSWVNGIPTISKKVILSESYNTGTNGSFDCCSLEVNTSKILTISTSTYVNVYNNIINNGTINVEDSGSIVQINDANTNSVGIYSIQRSATANNLDYIYWSSPVEGFSVSNLPSSHRYSWGTTALNANGTEGNWILASGAMGTGVGYISRVTGSSSVAFNGNINNGSLSVGVSKGSDSGSINDNYNLIGNPYPSSIDVDAFLYENANPSGPNPVIEGSIRIWSHGTIPSNSFPSPFYQNFQNNYNPNDYIIVNGTGSSTGPASFDGKIASGQGFFVVKEEGASSAVVNFNNAMRNKNYDNSQFFKNNNATVSNTIEKHRIWLNLIAQNGNSSRTLIGYITGATLAKDVMFDAAIEPSSMYLYSLIGTQKQVVQGRPVPFDENDLVPIGVKILTVGNYTISIAGVDGLFTDSSQNIYLEDTVLNVIHNLKQAPYTFSSTIGEFNSRFILKYTNTVLSNSVFENNSNFIISANDKVHVKSTENIDSVNVYDILGRTIFSMDKINNSSITLEKLRPSKEAIIVKTTLENGEVIFKKIIY